MLKQHESVTVGSSSVPKPKGTSEKIGLPEPKETLRPWNREYQPGFMAHDECSH